MALAIELGTTPDDLPEESEDIIAHFKNPAMPSIASTTDAALKIATARQGFADTDIFLEMIGFDQADIRRIRAQEQRAKGDSILTEEFENADNGEGMAGIHNEDVTSNQFGIEGHNFGNGTATVTLFVHILYVKNGFGSYVRVI